jgi:hypothetical protein
MKTLEKIRIAIYENKPIYVSQNGTIDYYSLIKALCNVLSGENCRINQLIDKDLDEYNSKLTIRGSSINDWLRGYNIAIWKWNPITNDFTTF